MGSHFSRIRTKSHLDVAMGPLPGTFDLRSSNNKTWSTKEGSEKKEKMVVNTTNKQNNNKNNNKVVNNKKSKAVVNRTTVGAVDNDMGELLPDLIMDSANTGGTKNLIKRQQISLSLGDNGVLTPLNQTQLQRSLLEDGGGLTTLTAITPAPGEQPPPPAGSHCITHACVSGFVPIRQRLQEIRDMAYVVDVTWSDGRTHMVKRTFADFYNFHFYLLDEWGAKECKEGPLKLTFFLPEREVEESEPTIETAECRELQLNKYVQELIKLPEQISACPTVLTFFESRGSDPKPYRESIGSSQMQVADQYVLCWI